MIVPRKTAVQNFDAHASQFNDEIDLSKLWIRLLRNKALAVTLAFLGALSGSGIGFQRATSSTSWSASSKTVLVEAIGSIKGVGAEPVMKEFVPWREADEVKKSLEKSLKASELTKLLASQQMEVLNAGDLEGEDLRLPFNMERRVSVKNREGRKIVFKFSCKFTGKLNELPATSSVESSDRAAAPLMLVAWLERVNEDLRQKKLPIIQKGLQIARDLKSQYAKVKPEPPSLNALPQEAAGNQILGGSSDTSKSGAVQLASGATIEFDPKLESAATAIRALEVMLELPVIQVPAIEFTKGASLLKQTVLGGALGTFLSLGLLGGVLLLQSLRSDSLESEIELAGIFPESTVLKLDKTQPVKAVSKTVLWAAWLHAGAETDAGARDFVLWQTGGNHPEALSELLVQEFRTHYPSLAVTQQKEPLSQTLSSGMPVAEAKEGLHVLSAAVSAESLQLVRKNQKVAIIINEAQPSMSEWKQNAAALELSGIQPNLVVLLS
jgi:hypothetical protein